MGAPKPILRVYRGTLLMPFATYHLDDGAIGSAEPQRGRARLRQNAAPVLPDRAGQSLAVIYLEPPMVNARSGTGQHRILAVFPVPFHQREIDVSVGQVTRHVIAMWGGAVQFEIENVFIKPGRLFEIMYLQGEVNDAALLASRLHLVAADIDDFGHAAVRCPEFQGSFFRIGKNVAAVLLDFFRRGGAILDFDAEMMDAGTRIGKFCFRLCLAVTHP